MSLYDIFGEDPLDKGSDSSKNLRDDERSSGKSLPSGLRLLQSQIHLRKTQLIQPQRNVVPPVVDLSARNRSGNSSVLRAHKAIPIGDGPPLSFIPKALKEDKVFLFGEVLVEDEYNPTAPTDYGKHKEKIEARKAKEKVAREIAERLHREHVEETAKRTTGAAIAPPQELVEADSHIEAAEDDVNVNAPMPPPSFIPSFGGAGKGLGVAANIMTKFGYKEGAGLGRAGQGMSTALKVEKLGKNAGLIVNEHEQLLKGVTNMGGETVSSPSPEPVAAPVAPFNMADALKQATRILLLRNMVGVEEIDDQLEPEVKDEMKKYGQVTKVLVYRILRVNDDEAVRIFVEFTNAAQAIKAFVDLNGRYFAGRSIRASFYDLDAYNSNLLDQ